MIKITLAITLILTSFTIHAARSTPVTVMNDDSTPVPVRDQNSTYKRFVGFSATTLDGAAGWPAINAACAASFGTGARLCSVNEIYMYGGPTVPMAPTRVLGYVNRFNPSSESNLYYQQAPCNGFRTNNPADLVIYVVDSDGGNIKAANPNTTPSISTVIGSCADLRPVACCQ